MFKNIILIGENVNLRIVNKKGAEFILSLRCDEKKSRFIHKTENNIEKQIDYINNSLKSRIEYYFIIENKNNISIGTIRVYNINFVKKNLHLEVGLW